MGEWCLWLGLSWWALRGLPDRFKRPAPPEVRPRPPTDMSAGAWSFWAPEDLAIEEEYARMRRDYPQWFKDVPKPR